MKKLLYLSAAILLCHGAYAQTHLNQKHIIELGKHYSSFMFANDASKELNKNLGKGYHENLTNAVSFIKEVTKSNNKILSDKFLVLPNQNTLKVVYIIDALHQNPHLDSPKDPVKLVDSLLKMEIQTHLLLDEYYETIFTSVGNKNKPFDMSKVNFKMSEYGLKTDREKAIFYLRCMDMCGTQIFGYMNIVKPPNTKEAMKYISKFPQFDGMKYFQHTDLQFEDFQLEIFNDKGLKSFKDHFINGLFKTLLNHAVCLSQEAVQDFLIRSSLKNELLWKHTELQEVLNSIFKKE